MITQPTDRFAVLAAAAQIIALNGLHHGDHVADPFNQRSHTAHWLRPMSVVGAINCAVSQDPRTPSNLAWRTIQLLARSVRVDGETARSDSIEDCERHVEAWSDENLAGLVVHVMRYLAGPSAVLHLSAVAA